MMQNKRTTLLSILIVLLVGCSETGFDNPKDENYIVRLARYDIRNEKLIVIHPDSPRVMTMDPWPQLVFLRADGQSTITQLISKLRTQYKDKVPPKLTDQVRSTAAQLVAEGLITFADSPRKLPYYLASSVSEQDPAKAKQLMIKDEFIRE